MLPWLSFADNVIDGFAFFLFGCFDGVLQQPPFQLLAVEIDVLAVGLEMGDSPLVGKLVHVGLRLPRKFACFGEVQDRLLSSKQSFDAVEPCSTVVFSFIIILFLAFNTRRCATLVM